MQEALLKKATNLRHIEHQKHDSDKKVTQILCNNDEEYRKLMDETLLEEYCDSLANLTFETIFIELSIDFLKQIQLAHNEWKNEVQQQPSATTTSATVIAHKYDALNSMKPSIDEAISRVGGYAFVRLSTRSMKDAALLTEDFSSRFKQALEEANTIDRMSGIDSGDVNHRLRALYSASTSAMAVTNSDQVLGLLVASSRIQQDLQDAVSRSSRFQLAVRRFESFQVCGEFRAFCYDRKLTCVTQYNEFCFFPELQSQRQLIEQLIRQSIEEVIKVIKLKHFVVDLILLMDPITHQFDRYRVVEINPLAEFAGTGLFTWENDRAVLLGQSPFELRLQTTSVPFIEKSIATSWQPFIFADRIQQEQ